MQFSITTILIIINVVISFAAFNNRKIIDQLIFYPPAVTNQGEWYRFFTCGFIHADTLHLIFNMVTLFFFGDVVEQGFTQLFGSMGKWLYLLMYVTALLFSILPTYFKNKHNYEYRSLGASGAVSAVLFAGLLLQPAGMIAFYFIPMPSFVFAPLYLIFTAYMDRKGGDNINHSAHLWGSLYGLAFITVASTLVQYPIIPNAVEDIRNFF